MDYMLNLSKAVVLILLNLIMTMCNFGAKLQTNINL
jgi:hypothetical protein